MATVEEIEKYCRNCVSRDFVNGKGLVCKRTRELPDFDEECENFEKDEELLKMAPPKPDDFPVSMTEEELLAEENLPKGVLYASVACILGVVAWSLISVSTGLGIYGYRSRISGRFRHAAGEGDTSRLRSSWSSTGIDQLCAG